MNGCGEERRDVDRRARWTRAMLCSLPLLLAALASGGCSVGEAPAIVAEQAMPVRTAPVELAYLDVSLRAVGTVAPRDEVRLSFKTPGVVASILVHEGDTVRAGQLLAELEQAEIEATRRQADAAFAKAERDLARAQALFKDGVATREQVQDLTTALHIARASRDAVDFTARFTRIEAPADGIVTRRLGEPREMVGAGQPLLVLGMAGRGWVVNAALADRDVVRVKVGDEAEVTLDAYPQVTLAGRVTKIAAAPDPATGTYATEVLVDGDELRLMQGLVARVQVHDGREEPRPVVPVTALLEADGGKAVVFTVDDTARVARRLLVRTGRFAGDRVEIAEGLSTGDRVVVEGAAYLRDGDAVRVLGAG